jgi:branched-chain amino acid transport system permease protein
MEDFLFFVEVLVSGLLSGVMYALVALGFVLVFKASGVFNFAQGSLVLFAALTFVLLLEAPASGGGLWQATGWLALVLGLVAGAYHLVVERPQRPLVSRRLANRVLIGLTVVGLIALTLAQGGDAALWRGVFITFMVFLVLVIGISAGRIAAIALFALAAMALLPGAVGIGEAVHFSRALVVTLGVMIVLAIAIERFILRALVNQEALILFMATIGLNFLLEGMAQGVWDAQVHPLDIGIDDVPIAALADNFGVFVSSFEVFAAVVAGVLVGALALFFNRTRVGRALRAVADDHQAALSVGISLQAIWAIVWSAAGVVALVAGLLWGTKLGVQFSLSLIVLKALPVLILGGLTSIPGAIVGGLIIGAAEKLFEVFVGLPYLGGGTESWLPYMLALLFLLIRPQGLFGEKIIERV